MISKLLQFFNANRATKSNPQISRKKKKYAIIFLFILMFIIAFWAINLGNIDINSAIFWRILGEKLFHIPSGANLQDITIVWDFRLPRILMAILSGIALACAGVIYQSVFRNPLVEPFILGVSSGAGFGASLAIILNIIFLPMQILAFIFAFLAVSIAYFLARKNARTNTVALVLSGIIIGAIFQAGISILKYLSEDAQLREITFWLLGGLYNASWGDVAINTSIILPCFLLAIFLSWKLNLLSLGEEEARALGLSVEFYKIIFIFIATLISSVCVSSVGIIAWVGLMMPHLARLIIGVDNRFVLPLACLFGAIYLILCDTIARTITQGEIPIGILTALLGAPFLLWILRAKGGRIFE